MELYQKKVLVIGAARSGLQTAEFLLNKEAYVVLNDINKNVSIPEHLKNNRNMTFLLGHEPDIAHVKPELIIVSPAVPLDKSFITEALEQNIEVIGEIELSYRFAKAPFIGITGTNGKTTTTSLIGDLFQKAEFETLVGGNIGNPLITDIENVTKDGVVVAEISSFQLETIEDFTAHVAIITNLTPDHLDRHKTMENYLDAKSRIFENQNEDDFLILNYDDPLIRDLAKKTKAKVLFFSRKEKMDQGAYLEDGYLTVSYNGSVQPIIKPEEIFIKGGHNLENAMAGALAALAMKIPSELIAEGLRTFKGVEHRLEFSGKYKGVTYVNDSKGTNPDASLKALFAYDDPIILIAGGRNKGNAFDEFAEAIKKRCKFAVLIGESKDEIKNELDKIGYHDYFLTDDYQAAVKKTVEVSEPGDVVILSPACASWDMFENYEIRGNQFKELVKKYNP